ncbi:hypothetical protein SmJEL517_g05954 [Synchytrium microbalum]|uniref:ABC1 atypical kinase-like domain-containing protein n=1 Tax=Synchytrium microbalum TaxID=1806994 RepID=A0A507BXP9_9FUNG|nr:uncharacterized protein SmJEL517_g05954 [Synchytrium microbalum]TPX30496.1 hypothetical protein SmJEL517_g05954 [Synchytrium microbalum]
MSANATSTTTSSETSTASTSASPRPSHRGKLRNLGLIFIVAYGLYVVYDFDEATLLPAAVFRFSTSMVGGGLIALDYKILHWRFRNKGYESAEYKTEREIVHRRAAKALLWIASFQGGIYVKAAQHLASLRYIIPDVFVDTLQQLQDRAPSKEYKVVRKIIKQEFGKDPHDLFAEFDETPFAAASIAQVHKATTRDGEAVVVKVQYPDVSRLFNVDIATMKIISTLITVFFDEFRLDWVVEEFKQNLIQEFNFVAEGRNCELTDARFAHRAAEIRCPRIRWDLTTKKVLVMEYVNGAKVNDIPAIKALGLEPAVLGRLISECFAEMVFCHGIVHCDPHAGNMLVVPSPLDKTRPQLIILDHGLYKVLDESFRRSFCLLWKAMVTNDVKLLRLAAVQLGVTEYAEHFPLIFIGRPIDGQNKLGSGMSSEERKRVREGFKKLKMGDVFQFLEDLPRDMLFSIRVLNLVRSLHRDLVGETSPRDRFAIFARYAVKGAYVTSFNEREAEAKRMLDERHKGGRVEVALYGGLSFRRPRTLVETTPDSIVTRIAFIRDFAYLQLNLWLLENIGWAVRWWRYAWSFVGV